MFLLQLSEEVLEVWSTEVRDGAQASEETAAGNLLEVALADVLQNKQKHCKCRINVTKIDEREVVSRSLHRFMTTDFNVIVLTSMVVLTSNFSLYCVM